MRENSLRNCGFVKTVLMLLVFIGHSVAFWTGSWFTRDPAIAAAGLGAVKGITGSVDIYGFALVSGYLFACKLRQGGYAAFGPFLKKKAKRLLVPYLFVMVIWVAPITGLLMRLDFGELFRKYILCIEPSQLWFLWMLFDVFAMVWPMRRVLTDRPKAGWCIALLFYGVGLVGGRLIPNVFCIWTACTYVPFFYIGMRIRGREEDGGRLITRTVPWPVWILAFAALYVWTDFTGAGEGMLWTLLHAGSTFILHAVGGVMAWVCLQKLADGIPWRDSRGFGALMSYSMPMYLFHQQIIYFTILALNGRVNPWINAGVNLAAAVLGSFIISALLMRWKTTRLLLGEAS